MALRFVPDVGARAFIGILSPCSRWRAYIFPHHSHRSPSRSNSAPRPEFPDIPIGSHTHNCHRECFSSLFSRSRISLPVLQKGATSSITGAEALVRGLRLSEQSRTTVAGLGPRSEGVKPAAEFLKILIPYPTPRKKN
jgi:hypothetical protein